jgi:hypothetical protein
LDDEPGPTPSHQPGPLGSNHSHHCVALAAAYGETGRLDHAKRAAANLRSLDPFFEVDNFGEAFRDPAERKRIQDGLRKAGL